MAVAIFAINKGVVVNEVFVASIVRGIDIDNVDFTLMGISERSESLEVIALNYNMINYTIVNQRVMGGG